MFAKGLKISGWVSLAVLALVLLSWFLLLKP